MNELFVNVKVDREERPTWTPLHAGRRLRWRAGRLADDRVPDARRAALLRRHVLPEDGPRRAPGFADLCRAIASAYRDRRDDVRARPPRSRGGSRRRRRDGRRGAAGPRDPGRRRRRPRPHLRPHRGRASAARPSSRPRWPWSSCCAGWRAGDDPTPDDGRAAPWAQMAAGGVHDQVGGGFHRYSVDGQLAGAPLREDALRQRAAGPRLRASRSRHHRLGRARAARAGDARLPAARDAPAARRLRGGPGRGLARGARAPSSSGRRRSLATLLRREQAAAPWSSATGSPPRATSRAAPSCGSTAPLDAISRPARRGRGPAAGRRAPHPLRGPAAAARAGARRQGHRRVERAGDRRLRGRRRDPRPRRLHRRRRRDGRLRHRRPGGRRPPAPHPHGGPRPAARPARRPRRPLPRPPAALRRHLPPALAGGGARAGGADGRALRRP